MNKLLEGLLLKTRYIENRNGGGKAFDHVCVAGVAGVL